MTGTPRGVVTSPRNDAVVAARKLQQRKGRLAARAFLVEGPHAVDAALAADRLRVLELFVTPDAAARQVELLRAAARRETPVRLVSDQVLAGLAETTTPQGVVGVARLPDTRLADVLAGPPRLVAVAVAAAEPGNVGALVRVADAAGADAVVVAGDSADPFGGKAVRASAGSIFHLPVVVERDPLAAVSALRRAGLAVLATAVDGTPLDPAALPAPVAWLFGSEAHGLPADVVSAADRAVRIPIFGAAESLNVASAAAVCLYASAFAQRRA